MLWKGLGSLLPSDESQKQISQGCRLRHTDGIEEAVWASPLRLWLSLVSRPTVRHGKQRLKLDRFELGESRSRRALHRALATGVGRRGRPGGPNLVENL